MRRTLAIALLAGAVLTSGACKKSKEAAPAPTASTPPVTAPGGPLTVTSVTLGRMLGADKKITARSDVFDPKDTIYASVDTDGTAASASISAKWTYQDGQTVNEETQPIATTGPATTEFHVSKPDGFPSGEYKVEILVDGVPVKTASFRVS